MEQVPKPVSVCPRIARAGLHTRLVSALKQTTGRRAVRGDSVRGSVHGADPAGRGLPGLAGFSREVVTADVLFFKLKNSIGEEGGSGRQVTEMWHKCFISSK